MCLADRVLVYGDCAVKPDPDAEQLADIAISSAATAAQFGIEPRVAMLSYSTGQSGSRRRRRQGARGDRAGPRSARPDLPVEGPIQYDAAVDAGVARTKLPDSAVAGRATVFIFPDLNTGNNTYKAVQRSAGRGRHRAGAAGPAQAGQRPVPRRDGRTTSSTPSRSPRSRPRPGRAAGERRDPGPGGQRRVVVAEVPARSTAGDAASGSRPGWSSGSARRPARARPRGPTAAPRRRSPTTPALRGRSRRSSARPALAEARRGRPPGRPRRRRASPTPAVDRRRRARGDPRAGAAGAAAQPGQPRRHRGRPRAAPRTCRRSRSSTPRSTRRCRRTRYTYAVPRDLAERLRSAATASTAPRTRTSRAGRRRAAGPAARDSTLIVLHLGNGASAAAVRGGRWSTPRWG